MDKRLGWIFAITAAVIYSLNIPIARGAILEGMSPILLLVGRFSLGAFLFTLTLSLTPVGRTTPGNRPLDRFGVWVAIGSGLLNGVMITTFFIALETISASIMSMVSIALVQFFTLGLLLLRGEPITGRSAVRLLVGLGGLYFLVGFGGVADVTGLLLLTAGPFYTLSI